ncbi:MAG TPA: L-glutamate gamma-semialdehyde dehydrogenase, partial [Steroidobacteraceae bacterium]|nr:L-glutamate gamma-semialdehyde dehydrogenase [Steroidobacteraceae bacterium]
AMSLDAAMRVINRDYLADEATVVRRLADRARLPAGESLAVQQRALQLVDAVRRQEAEGRRGGGNLEAFLQQYSLASQEGVILMCLAEALLRIPDAATADALIADRIGGGSWSDHLGDSDSLLVNASTWGLMLTGRLVAFERSSMASPLSWVASLAGRLGEPVVRAALRQAMRIMGHQFVMGRDIEEALRRATGEGEARYRHSFDMLGEAALSQADADRYFDAYIESIAAIGRHVQGRSELEAPGISVKLSALHPRYEYAQQQRVLRELTPRLAQLLRAARDAGIGLTVDAEESERLELSLRLCTAMLQDPAGRDYAGFGLAVQAYQKRAPAVLDFLAQTAREQRRRICVRLVKGAYWDSEIKRAQERGLAGFPVYTRKINTDVAYLACARQLHATGETIYPQFATHNAHTVAYVLELFADRPAGYEFQRLHGMGEALYAQVIAGHPCRVYAPVGAHKDLLPYLVRRLLENGANSSFVNRIVDERLSPDDVVRDPQVEVDSQTAVAHPRIALPGQLYGAARANSRGVNLADEWELGQLQRDVAAAGLVTLQNATMAGVAAAVSAAADAQREWDVLGAAGRAAVLERAADFFEQDRAALIAHCIREGGRTLADSISEVREAIDYLRYYAAQARKEMGSEQVLAGPVGEYNALRWRGRGVFACISPWNFPVAIFTGQIAAALSAGNAVIAKPAEQTPLCGAFAVELLHRAGVPRATLQLLAGDGRTGAALVADPRIAGVAFTGSTSTARAIAVSLAARDGPIATLIAETGGLNALIADSSALPEQLVPDVIASAFNSAGQRCSALRVLFVQEDIADRVLQLLAGAMDELVIGDPALLSTDVGPVIDAAALAALERHAAYIATRALWQHRRPLPAVRPAGTWFAPLAVEVDLADVPKEEVFGPILHIVRFAGRDIEGLVDIINGWGYGLTLGIHTRIERLAQSIAARALVGNVYVNRNVIGAVVGVQPFGGRGLSGTGPKAGGPGYLPRFATEQTVSINTSAVGGNASLLSLS